MPRFAANLTYLYNEVPFLDRFAAAARDGFRGVEFLFPYEYPPAVIAGAARAAGVEIVLFNTPAGDWSVGERGFGAMPGREADCRAGVIRALEYAAVLGCPRVHVLAGLAAPGADRAVMRATFVANLREAVALAARQGVTLVIEPINTRDIPGYFLNRQDEAASIIAEIGAPNLKTQMDLYHCQIVEGDVAMKIRKYAAHVGHMQIAGVPARHEPDIGELNYPYLFAVIDEVGYDGWVGCEYRPRNGTSAGLGWLGRAIAEGSSRVR